jgi:FkbM family methyltransferase
MAERPILNAIFPGDIVFDVGANAGDKAQSYLDRGARMVCIEPQPEMISRLKHRFSDNPRVDIVEKALGRRTCEMSMSICSESPTISTMSDAWKKGRFSNQTWDQTVGVNVTTLDQMVLEYGIRRYTKIDVEGFEKEVVSGLSRRLGIISFEFTSEYLRDAFEVLGHLIGIGYSNFNAPIGESNSFALGSWVKYYDLVPILLQNCQQHSALWGDIYAN